MSVTVAAPETGKDISLQEALEAPRIRWTRAQCRELVEKGVLKAGSYELIQGDLVPKVGQSEPHVWCCHLVQFALVALFGPHFVRVAAPTAVDDNNEPEPDVSVTVQPGDVYVRTGTPTPQDVRLAVEVSVSTLSYDLNTKARLYAQSGIPEYVVLDVNGQQLHVHRTPRADGYASITRLANNEVYTPLAAPNSSINVADLLPSQ